MINNKRIKVEKRMECYIRQMLIKPEIEKRELEYAIYYEDEENCKESIELANLQSDTIETYEEWLNSEKSKKLREGYKKYYNCT